MHLGHQQLFKNLGDFGAIVVIQTGYANLTPYQKRQNYTNYPIFYYPLEHIKHLEAKEFLDLLKQEFPNIEKIVVGYDFRFGSKAAYDTNDLKKLFKGSVEIVSEYKYDNISVHSRVIREYLRNGEIILANNLLGHTHIIEGIHIKGQGLGKKQFVPTINLDIDAEYLIPQEGIYVTRTSVNNIFYHSVTFIGHRMTTDNKYAVETHLIDTKINNFDFKKVKVEFLKKIRENQKYDKYEDLKIQILQDIEKVKEYFL
jgi:riboflavin kinase/FMN adenylyltransferase